MKTKIVYLISYLDNNTVSMVLYKTKYHFDSYCECLLKVNELNQNIPDLVFYCVPTKISNDLGDIND